MTGLLTFLIVFVPIFLIYLRLYSRDRTRIAAIQSDQALAFAKAAGLLVPSELRTIVPQIKLILGGENCRLIDGEKGTSIGTTHHRLFDWFCPPDQSLHSETATIRIETRIQLDPYGVVVTLKNGEVTEGQGWLTPEPEGRVGSDRRMWRAEIDWRGRSITFEPKKLKGIPKGHDIYLGGNLVGSALRIFDRIDPRVLLLESSLPDLTALVLFYVSTYGLGNMRDRD